MLISPFNHHNFTPTQHKVRLINDQHMDALKKQIQINNETFLKDIQTSFNAYYPYLKIEFLEPKKYSLEPRLKNDHYSMQVKDLLLLQNPIAIDVSNGRTIEDIIKDFKKNTGTTINVSRKSGNIWNVITLTGSWTLESQNNAGLFISSEMQLTG